MNSFAVISSGTWRVALLSDRAESCNIFAARGTVGQEVNPPEFVDYSFAIVPSSTWRVVLLSDRAESCDILAARSTADQEDNPPINSSPHRTGEQAFHVEHKQTQ